MLYNQEENGGNNLMKNLIKKLDKNLVLIGYEYEGDTLTIDVESKKKKAICPHCGKESNSIQSRYTRKIQDLPMQGYKVLLNVHARNFYCKNKKCKHRMFAEKFEFYESYSRMTNRLKDEILETSKGMSARASKEIVNKRLAKTSDDTILRIIKKNGNNK